MPSSAQAAIVFLVLVLPGYLARSGYRYGRAVPEHSDGLVLVTRVIALSVAVAVVAWPLGGREVYENARAGVALTSAESHTYRFVLELLLVPAVGFAAGQAVDAAARWVAGRRARRSVDPGGGRSRVAWEHMRRSPSTSSRRAC
jgi:hypothetical protein